MSDAEILGNVMGLVIVIIFSIIVLQLFNGFDFEWSSAFEMFILSFVCIGGAWIAILIFSVINMMVN